ncbi:MAG: putative esterase [Planctomycetota bacterium]|jgi:predicted esterase
MSTSPTEPDEQPSSEHILTVQRTARFQAFGELKGDWKEVWYVLHGYGQLASEFGKACSVMANPERLVVAPEGLSRFYPKSSSGSVGASWMTSLDREAEIADTVAYLRAVDREVRGYRNPGAAVSLLGFSQGAAAAARAVVLGGIQAKRLVLWGGGFPPDLEEQAARSSLANVEVILAVGKTDPFIDEESVTRETERLEGVAPNLRVERFEGGHTLQRTLLRSLATGQ